MEMHGVETANLVFDYFSVEDIRMVSKGRCHKHPSLSKVETAELEYFIMYLL